MKKLFALFGALLLWQSVAVAQNVLHIWTGDSTRVVRMAELDSVTVRDRMFYGYTDEDWVSIGAATYQEDLVTTLFGVENVVYEVEVQTIPEAPGFYRLVNPYGEAYPYNEPGDYATNKNHYMVINAQDPEGVYIERHYSGMNWGYGEFIFHSYAGYYLEKGHSLEEIKAAGYCGTLVDGVITFPAGKLLIGMANYNGGGLYTSNANGLFRVILPNYTDAPNAPARKCTPKNIERKIANRQSAPFALEQKTVRQVPAIQRAIPTPKAKNESSNQFMMCPIDRTVK